MTDSISFRHEKQDCSVIKSDVVLDETRNLVLGRKLFKLPMNFEASIEAILLFVYCNKYVETKRRELAMHEKSNN